MRRLAKQLSQGERLVLVGGILLICDLVLLPWHSVDIGDLEIAFDPTRSGIEEPNGGYGVAAVIFAAVMIVQIVVARLTPLRLPDPPLVPWSQVHLVAGIFAAVVLVIKLVRETELLGYGAYSGILAALLVAYGGYRIAQEAAAEPADGDPV